jgi:ribonuclease BN (tRNA processing enzyme)
VAPVRFTVLGSGTALPDAHRGPAGFLLEAGETTILIDGGSGTLGRLAKQGIDPVAITAGVYSHRHVDHTGDLVPLLFAMRLPPGRQHPYPIYAGQGFRGFFESLEAVYGRWIQPPGGATIAELPLDGPGEATIGPVRLLTRPARHSAGALHLRFEVGPHAIVFSGDTSESEALVELATGADLLVVECAGSDHEPVEGHMTPSSVARLLEGARPAQCWITHLFAHVEPGLAMATIRRTGLPARRAADGDRWSPASA